MASYTTTTNTNWDRESTFDYLAEFSSVSDWDPGIPLRAETGSMISLDTMIFVDTGNGAEVTYDAQITLKGPLKLADPLFGLAFKRIGDKAAGGLRKRLAGAPPAGAE